MTPSTEYQKNKESRNTADAGSYDLTTDGTKTTIWNNGKDVSANYDISGSGTLTVDKATLTLDTGSTTKFYGDATGVKGFLMDKQTNYTLKLRTPETLMRQGFIGFSDIRRHHIMHTVSGTFPINRAVLP